MDNRKSWRRWLEAVIHNELGDLSALPQTTQQCVYRDYEDLARAYLGWLRIEMGKPDNWLPQPPGFDDRLVSQMDHFFSEYRHLVARRRIIRKLVRRLLNLEPVLPPAVHAELIREIEGVPRHESDFDTVFNQLRDSDDKFSG